MTRCDTCGAEGPLEDLLEQYRTREIRQVCSQCIREINKQNGNLLEMAIKMKASWLKRFMANMRARKVAP